MMENARGPSNQDTQWIQSMQCQARSLRLLLTQHKGPKDTKSLATFTGFSCFLHAVGETACLVGKTIAQGQSTGYIHQKEG